MAPSVLPLELIDSIVSHLPRSALISLSSTSSRFLPVAQRWLYRYIYVTPSHHNLPVVLILAKNPHLACLVRSFTVNIDPTLTVFSSFYHQLSVALKQMNHLVNLDIFIDRRCSWVLPPASQFPSHSSLLHFSSAFSFDVHVASFLSNTPALLELELDPVSPELQANGSTLSDEIAPCLQRFSGSTFAAQAIIPSRPVSSIHLNAGDLSEALIRDLIQASVPITTLSATATSSPIPLLESIADLMPRLVYLRLLTTYKFPEAPNFAFYDSIAHTLSSLDDLEAFELSGMHWGCIPRRKTDQMSMSRSPSPPPTSESVLVGGEPNNNEIFAQLSFLY